MREALHVIDNEIVKLPYTVTADEVANFKKLAKKEIYQCAHCQAKLVVKYGEIMGLYFSHQHSEACEESRIIDKAEKKYTKQTERESKLHRVMVDIILDELKVKAKVNENMYINLGYKEKPDWKEYPDIYVRLPDKELAVSIITNVNSSDDERLAQQIKKRHKYFNEKGLETTWFIEKKEQAIEKDKSSIILWDAELSIASKTSEDKKWDKLITSEISDERFHCYFNYPTPLNYDVDVKSLYYIFDSDEKIVIKIQHFLKDRIVKPLRALLLNEGYELPFSEALAIENGFKLSNPKIEEKLRDNLRNKIKEKKDEYAEQLYEEEEMEKKRIEKEYEKKELRLKTLLMEDDENKVSDNDDISYNELKILLKNRINLKQKEQVDLYNQFIMRKVGMNKSKLVWDITVRNNCKSYAELRKYLEKI
jgi:Competence protein CoiA-like family